MSEQTDRTGVAGETPPAPQAPGHDDHYWYHGDKAALTRRLKRIEGQIRGIQRMVDDDQYCIDILTQISASTKGLQAVALNLLEGHLAHCVAEAQTSGDPTAAEAKVKEASDAVARLLRT
ncbi:MULTISPECIES: metal-sensitive transcriptional regulator [Glycomyces]|jgi:CsoR family transcriptional regulator, copper-sensing transcriptional repressor|uniref:DNA-binding FrmR family transcriptional regulator n=2 Tax=Glycomyces TaxID=58113 RepID=A0A9X3PX08_9ACTN|nr:metal-sensitive transcriptional regulator [Glycomyces lechevalierae]MDA1387518.1 metal-sensitive transcriptional regulator [Glycomyces lechevalierae]MDR7338694.1 DNA-binding FrmR family transcriptional regulator [Glycomyces lechevalierae]